VFFEDCADARDIFTFSIDSFLSHPASYRPISHYFIFSLNSNKVNTQRLEIYFRDLSFLPLEIAMTYRHQYAEVGL